MSRRCPCLLVMLLAVACQPWEEPRDAPEPDGKAPSHAAERPPAARPRPGRIEGIVRFEGELPPSLPVTMTGPRAAACAAAKGVYELSVVRGTDGGLANVFVSVEGIPSAESGGSPSPQTRTVVIDGCVIKPYVMDATAGDTLEIRNEDDHVYLCNLTGTPEAILKQGVLPGQVTTWPLGGPGGHRIDCTTDHPWLFGHLLVSRHPWHAVTTASGRFVIDDVPSGRRRVQAWHPTQRQTSAEVVVPPGGVGRVELVYRGGPAPAKVPGKRRAARE